MFLDLVFLLEVEVLPPTEEDTLSSRLHNLVSLLCTQFWASKMTELAKLHVPLLIPVMAIFPERPKTEIAGILMVAKK